MLCRLWYWPDWMPTDKGPGRAVTSVVKGAHGGKQGCTQPGKYSAADSGFLRRLSGVRSFEHTRFIARSRLIYLVLDYEKGPLFGKFGLSVWAELDIDSFNSTQTRANLFCCAVGMEAAWDG